MRKEKGVYQLEYEAWKAMGGDESVVGSREERQDYSARGLYARKLLREAINRVARDEPRRFENMAEGCVEKHDRGACRTSMPSRSTHGVDKEDLLREDANAANGTLSRATRRAGCPGRSTASCENYIWST